MDTLPDEIFQLIFGFLDPVFVCVNCSRVCTAWHAYATEKLLWKHFCKLAGVSPDGTLGDDYRQHYIEFSTYVGFDLIFAAADGFLIESPNKVALDLNGPKLLISDRATSNGFMKWHLGFSGNCAFDVGIVPDRRIKINTDDPATHYSNHLFENQEGSVGFHSDDTCEGDLPLRFGVGLKQDIVTVVYRGRESSVEFLINDKSVHKQEVPCDVYRLACTMWNGGVIHLIADIKNPDFS